MALLTVDQRKNLASQVLKEYEEATAILMGLVKSEQEALKVAQKGVVVDLKVVKRAKGIGVARLRLSLDLAWAFYRLYRALLYGQTPPSKKSGRSGTQGLNEVWFEFTEAKYDAIRGVVESQNVRELSDLEKRVKLGDFSIFDIFGQGSANESDDLPEIVDSELIDLSDEDDVSEAVNTYSQMIERYLIQRVDQTVERHNMKVENGESQRDTSLSSAFTGAVGSGEKNLIGGAVLRDRRMYGYARVSKTGSPCSFCSMLISRGAIYRSANAMVTSSKARRDIGEKYHDHCFCTVVPVASKSEYENNPRFAMNRVLRDAWKKHMEKERFDSRAEMLEKWDEIVDKHFQVKAKRERQRMLRVA